jgi:CubicO group peptidase (beta-lactamase class C family)
MMSLAMDQGPTDLSAQANLSNWRTLPFSHWAFRNVRKLIPVADIDNTGDASPFAARPVPFTRFRLTSAEGASLTLEDALRATATDGLVIVHDGRIAYEFYDHGTTAQTPHIVMSVTKSVTGLVAGILQARGVLDIDAPVSNYVPEIAGTAYRGASVRHLLDMRTGIVLDAQQLRDYAVATNWDAIAPGETPIGLHTFFANLTAPHRAHGGACKYVSANGDLLGWVIERAAGKTFASLVSDLLWKPMGAEHPAHIAVDCEGAPRSTGGLCATTRDIARLGQLVVGDGNRGSDGVIPSALIDDIADNGDRAAWRQGEFAPFFGGRDMSYRSGWYVIHDEPTLLFAMGIHGQNLFVDRRNRLVIAKLSSQGASIDPQASALTHRAVAETRRCLVGT